MGEKEGHLMGLDLKDENSEAIFHNNINILNRLENPMETEESSRLQSMGHKGSDMTEQLTHRYTHTNVPGPPQLNLKIPSAVSLTNDCTFKSMSSSHEGGLPTS